MQPYALELRLKSFYEETLYNIIGTISIKYGSLVIAPTIGFVVARGGFYSYCIHQGSKSDKERKSVRKSKN